MPNYTEREYRVGQYWLSQIANSPAWYRTWYCEESRQTKRRSLGTKDFQTAKEKLNEWFINEHRPENESLTNVLLVDVLLNYYNEHASKLRSADAARRACDYYTEYFKGATLQEAFKPKAQQAFMDWLKEKQCSANYITRIITVGRAAINRAHKHGEINSIPAFLMPPPERSEPKGRPLELKEMASLFRACEQEHIELFLWIMVCTACRPEAALELERNQIDFNNRLINLQPTWRIETKKYRPTVRLVSALAGILSNAKGDRLVMYKGKPVKSVKTSFRKLRVRAGLDDKVNPYSIRHTMAREMRKRGVDAWQVAAQLGHKLPGMRTTEIYTAFSPDYLKQSTQAIEDYTEELLELLAVEG